MDMPISVPGLLLGTFVGAGLSVLLVNGFYWEWLRKKEERRKQSMFFRCVEPIKGISVGEVWEMMNYTRGQKIVWMYKNAEGISSSVMLSLDDLDKHFEYVRGNYHWNRKGDASCS